MHLWVTQICTHGYFGCQTSHPDLWGFFPTDHPEPQVKNPQVHGYLWVSTSDRSLQVLTSIPTGTHIKKWKNHTFHCKLLQSISTMLLSDSGSVVFIIFCFFLVHQDLFLNKSMIVSLGIKPSNLDQDPKMVAARAELSESECWSLEIVKPPWEKAHSTSVEVANEDKF